MSIIYDALKKAQKAIGAGAKPQSAAPPLLLYALIICLGLFILNTFFTLLSRSKKSTAAPTEPLPLVKKTQVASPASPIQELPEGASVPATAKKELLSSLVLNGIFFSENEGYALINNRIVKEGDTVEGATVKQINLDGVELERDNITVKLSSP